MNNITLVNAAAKTSAFRSSYPNRVKAIVVSQNDLSPILGQTGCVGVRFYFSLEDTSDSNSLNLVAVGIDNNGNDMTSGIMKNSGNPCPPYCSQTNSLNSD
jgi:hypothetical protein